MNKSPFAINFNKIDLIRYLNTQLINFFPDNYNNIEEINNIIDDVLDRLLYSLKFVKLNSHSQFHFLHSDLYAQFIYLVSNTAFNKGYINLAEKSFYLNKSLHGINCSYTTELPEIFLFLHIVGTVLGKAKYYDFLVVNQNVTVGSNKGESPIINEGVMLRPNSSVIGKSIIGKNSSLSINATVFNSTVLENKIVIGKSPNLIIIDSKYDLLFEEIFYKK